MCGIPFFFIEALAVVIVDSDVIVGMDHSFNRPVADPFSLSLCVCVCVCGVCVCVSQVKFGVKRERVPFVLAHDFEIIIEKHFGFDK